MDSKVTPVVGIDLGTTTTGIAFYNEATGRAEMIGENDFLFPSVVRVNIDPSAPIFVGRAAEINLRRNEFRICEAKRLIGRKFNDWAVDDISPLFEQEITTNNEGEATIRLTTENTVREITAQQITSEIFKHAAARYYDRYFPTEDTKPPLKAVITVPANFSESQRAATQEAAQIAGIQIIRLIAEPIAAATAYLSYNSRKSENFGLYLVFDFGGGTLDVSLVQKRSARVIILKGTVGETFLGGRDIDSLLFDYIVKIIGNRAVMSYEKNVTKRQKRKIDAKRAHLRKECKIAKEYFSGARHDSYAFDLSEYYDEEESESESESEPVIITREFFEELFYKKFIPRLMSLIAQLLRKNCTKIEDIKSVFLVGGSSKIPVVRRYLQAFFKDIELINTINPEHVICLGAAYLAHRIVNGGNGDAIVDRRSRTRFITNEIKIMFGGTSGFVEIISPAPSSYKLLMEGVRTSWSVHPEQNLYLYYLEEKGSKDYIIVTSDPEYQVAMSYHTPSSGILTMQLLTSPLHPITPLPTHSPIIYVESDRIQCSHVKTKPTIDQPQSSSNLYIPQTNSLQKLPEYSLDLRIPNVRKLRTGKKASGMFVSHVTYPDDCKLSPGTPFKKTWKLANLGCNRWEIGSRLKIYDEFSDSMGDKDHFIIPNDNLPPPGYYCNVSADFTAPEKEGTYIGYWRMADSKGSYFGERLRVKISVVVPKPAKW